MRKPFIYLVTIGLFVSVLLIFWHVDQIQQQNHQQMQKGWTLNHLSNFRGRLENVLSSRLLLLNGLSAMVRSQDVIDEDEFQNYAAALFKGNTGVRSLQLAPKAVVKHVFPHKGNEAIIGHDLLADEKRRDDALKSIEQKAFVVAGPLELLQGGQALIARLPIYSNQPTDVPPMQAFWGFATILLDIEPLYRLAGLYDLPDGLQIAIRGRHGTGADGEIFFGNPLIFNQSPEVLPVLLPHGEWQIAALPSGGWQTQSWNGRTIFWLIGNSLAFLTALSFFLIMRFIAHKRENTVKLEEMVRERTDELALALEKAQAAAVAKSKFLAVVSHELRTPLNGITGMTELLSQTELSAEQKDFIESLTISNDLLFALVNDILDFSKIEAKAVEIEKIPFNLHKKLSDLHKIAEGQIGHKDIKLVVEGTTDPHQIVQGDYHKIMRVMTNFINNAVKFTEKGEIRIGIAIIKETEKTVTAQFSVKDSGIGIPEEKQAALFKPFSQVDASISRKFGGTGLGLAICRGLIEQMNGHDLKVTSQPNKGASFSFCLTLAKSEKLAPLDTDTHTYHGQVLNILLAEDNKINQKVAIGFLNKMGHKVTIANNGQEAVDLVKTNHFDLILMDIHMPEKNGLEATREIRKFLRIVDNTSTNESDIPIIAMTADVNKDTINEFLQLDMQGLIPKPVRFEQLQKSLSLYHARK